MVLHRPRPSVYYLWSRQQRFGKDLAVVKFSRGWGAVDYCNLFCFIGIVARPAATYAATKNSKAALKFPVVLTR